MEEDRNVIERGEIVRDAGSSEEVREAEQGHVKGTGGVGERSEGDGVLVGVDLDKPDEGVDTGGERTATDDIVRERLRKNGLSAEDCSHGVSEGRGV